MRYGQDWDGEPSRVIEREDDGPYVLHSDYATLAAAARRLVEAIRFMDEAWDTVYRVANKRAARDEMAETHQNAVKVYLEAFAEVEALLGEG